MNNFADYFSENAKGYASHRPRYPKPLYEWLATQVPARRRAWDCGTGSGQAAVDLARYFEAVIATDPSQAQLSHATQSPGVHYAAMTAEASGLRGNSMDLVTVAQAIHWFHLSRFYTEVGRVLVDGGILAAWMYGLMSVDEAIDEHVRQFYAVELGEFWPAERALVDAGYSALVLPFDPIEPPAIAMAASWTLDQFEAYISTWSAVTRYKAARGESPVGRFIASIGELWGAADTPRMVTWPLQIIAGRKQP